jgi:hypothetical protein
VTQKEKPFPVTRSGEPFVCSYMAEVSDMGTAGVGSSGSADGGKLESVVRMNDVAAIL